jgi:hypothetical protein
MLVGCNWPDVDRHVDNLHVRLQAFAITCRCSSTSDGLVRAWGEAGKPWCLGALNQASDREADQGLDNQLDQAEHLALLVTEELLGHNQ